MRRFLLLMALSLLLLSCGTTPEPAGQAAEQSGQPADETAPAPHSDLTPDAPDEVADGRVATDDAATSDEPGAATIVPVDEPPTLELVNPIDPTRITRSPFILSAVASEGELQSIEIELLGGPIAADVETAPFEIVNIDSLTAERRLFEVPVTSDAMLVRIPRGFVDGAVYELRLRGRVEDGRVTEWISFEPALDLGVEPPRPVLAASTIDTSPRLSLDADGPVEVIVDDESSFVAERGGELEMPFDLTAGRYLVRARTVTADGYITGTSLAVDLRILADARPAPVLPLSGETTLSARVGLQWGPVTGGVGYQARYRSTGADAWQQLNPTPDTFTSIPERIAPGSELEWQVRVQNEAGTWFSWSTVARFTVGSFEVPFVTVVGAGQSATVTRGSDDGSRDEQPVRRIELTRGFQMAVTPLSNAQVVRLIDFAATRGLVSVDEAGVWTVGDEPRALVGLGEMDYGEQFGLRFQDEAIGAVPGRESHPAIGITWLGAVHIANLLSYVEGRAPVYGVDGDLLGPEANGYRLPTEAEWEYAARGTTDRLFPWGGSLSGRVSNYYRSFDPFEDVNEPFTANGGPTNPVGFFDGSVRGGFQTASDASPFGVRDMVGNVWEWCHDRYDPNYYATSPEVDPLGPDETDFRVGNDAVVLAAALDPNQRVVRGSAWNTRSPDVRLTNRGRYSEGGRSYSIGVRLVRAPLP